MILELHPDVESDIRVLPSIGAQRAAVQAIADVRSGRRVGLELDWHVGVGDLRDCRKVYFDASDFEGKPRFRLVYQVLEARKIEVLHAEVITVGERENLSAYHTAAARLSRKP